MHIMSYFIELSKIYKNLVLSTFSYSLENVDNGTMIINLCKKEIKSDKNKLIYNFTLSDSLEPSYNNFKNIVNQVIDLIKLAEICNHKVIVNCLGGVNRSCSMVIAYAVLEKELSVEEAVNYIKNDKKKKYYIRWDTMTNTMFLEFLTRMKNEII